MKTRPEKGLWPPCFPSSQSLFWHRSRLVAQRIAQQEEFAEQVLRDGGGGPAKQKRHKRNMRKGKYHFSHCILMAHNLGAHVVELISSIRLIVCETSASHLVILNGCDHDVCQVVMEQDAGRLQHKMCRNSGHIRCLDKSLVPDWWCWSWSRSLDVFNISSTD